MTPNKRRWALLAPTVGLGATLLIGAGPPAVAAVPDDAGTGRAIVLRPNRIDLVLNNRVVRVIPRPARSVDLVTLSRRIGSPLWLSVPAPGVVRLRAALLQRPGTSLQAGPGVGTVQLVDSPTSPAFIDGVGAVAEFDGVTITSATSTLDTRPAPESAHRGYVRYTGASVLTLRNSTLSNLGRPDAARTGLTLGAGSRLVARASTVRAGTRGLDADHAAAVDLDGVTAQSNRGPGIVLSAVSAVSLANVTTRDNGGTGLLLDAARQVRFAGAVNAGGNTGPGVAVTDMTQVAVSNVTVAGNGRAGLLLRRCTSCTVTRPQVSREQDGVRVEASPGVTVSQATVTAVGTGIDIDSGSPQAVVDSPTVRGARATGVLLRSANSTVTGGTVSDAGTAVLVTAPANRVAVRGVTVTGGATGINLAQGVTASSVDAVHVTSAAEAGVRLGGQDLTLTNSTIEGSRVGVRVQGSATRVQLDQNEVRQAGSFAVQVTTGTRAVAISRLSTTQAGGTGLGSGGEVTLADSTLRGAAVGLDIDGAARVSASTVTNTREAVRAGRHARVQLVGDTLQAGLLGIRAAQSASVSLEGTAVQAAVGTHGPVVLRGNANSIPALPLHWLGVVGLTALLAAAALELVRGLRRSSDGRRPLVPPHVTNIS